MLNRLRNIRKRWIVISAVGALLAIALVSGVALAADARVDLMANTLHDGYGYGRHGKSNSDALLLRVAEIVGVEQSTLAAAFGTARTEQVDARFDSYAGLLVAGGTLTQEQADEADTWFSDRPTKLDKIKNFSDHIPGGGVVSQTHRIRQSCGFQAPSFRLGLFFGRQSLRTGYRKAATVGSARGGCQDSEVVTILVLKASTKTNQERQG